MSTWKLFDSLGILIYSLHSDHLTELTNFEQLLLSSVEISKLKIFHYCLSNWFVQGDKK